MTRIILIGYMGAGKTTIGKALSKELGVIFYDLDWYIESRMRKSVAQIFAERGEEGFRKIEYNMLHEVAEFENVIISCGGGTPCFFDNMDYLNQQGKVVYGPLKIRRSSTTSTVGALLISASTRRAMSLSHLVRITRK